MRLPGLFRATATAETSTAGAVGPHAVELTTRHLRIGDGHAASFAVTGYPAEVGAGWLEPLLCYPGPLDVAVHVEPLASRVAADRLRRQLARLESGRREGADKGRLEDFDVDAAAEDARAMAAGLAHGELRLFRVGLYLTVHAPTLDDIDAALVAHARHPDTTGTLTAWWSETRCTRHFGDHVRPDGYGRWTDNDTDMEWFLEYDFGTEDLGTQLAARLTPRDRWLARMLLEHRVLTTHQIFHRYPIR